MNEILQCGSVSFVGMEKNTGKTECMNSVLSACCAAGKVVGLTSVGLDGESTDQVTGTAKPEIPLAAGSLFVTAEKYFRQQRLAAEVLAVSRMQTAVGRLVTARMRLPGKVMLSGPVSTAALRQTIRDLRGLGSELVLVDGALSRKSFGSPTVTDGLVLSTGAALSPNLPELVRRTQYLCALMDLPRYESPNETQLLEIEGGIWALTDDGQCVDLGISSAFLLEKFRDRLFAHGHRLFVSGAVGDKLLDFLRIQPEIHNIELVIKDFTQIFASVSSFRAFEQKGGRLRVLLRPRLLGVSVNPWSPSGYVMDSERLCAALREVTQVPVFDVRNWVQS